MIDLRLTRRAFGAALVAGATRAMAAAEPVPGVVVHHSPPATGRFIGSPGLAVLPGGTYLAKCDLFGPGTTENLRATTLVFASMDRGASWSPLASVDGLFWSSIFPHRGAVYMIGTTCNYGQAVALRSQDSGRTWTAPADDRTGIILPPGHYHTAPVPVVSHAGRLWRGMEELGGPDPHLRRFRPFMMSAAEDADLLRADSWQSTNRLDGHWYWRGGRFGGWLEGNAVVTPAGGIADVLRVEDAPLGGTAAVVRVSADGARTEFNPLSDFIRLPGGEKKFTIRRDAAGRYWSLVNQVLPADLDPNPGRVRNTQTLVSSDDLRHWRAERVLLHHPDVARHGFQYLDWLFDGPDLIALSRTAFDGPGGPPRRAHDANFLTFHRFPFRPDGG